MNSHATETLHLNLGFLQPFFRGIITCSDARFCILLFRMLAQLLHCLNGSVRLFNIFSQKEISQQKCDDPQRINPHSYQLPISHLQEVRVYAYPVKAF